MSKNQYLIVGGSGEAGQSALQTLRNIAPDAVLIASTTSESNVEGADITLKRIFADQNIVTSVKEQLKTNHLSSEWEAIIYTPALGEVGFPIRTTTKKALSGALSISYDPMILLETEFKPRLTVAYSAFYWLPHTYSFYGSMGYVKKKMDEWAFASPTNRRIIRAGTFFSKSVRGISLILQRSIKKTDHPEMNLLKEEWEKSGKKFQDFFLDYAWMHEKKAFQEKFPNIPYRHTSRDDLGRGLKLALQGNFPVTTVLGDWEWTEDKMPDLPEWFQSSSE
ncbi:hypothetical protein [Leptospira ilyithenensis]|uniref:SDR family NAD(P)-dependent oxidoreductase n=1 Tax=Leptospira ilyithenensis TaxID=2484901 RepID=A0A4R9LT45_9LEPT|nr:hypothetical protein [Leptospira ilyithenensis]TGN13159.1 hypothetical protein EHS11_04480 [Leptospira ilyithenensis]